MERTRRLHTGLIPPQSWSLYRWVSAHPLRYYYTPGNSLEIGRDESFYRCIDPALRPLCRDLHAQGIHTAPSCQGHFHNHDWFARVWRQMRREEEKIRNDGLSLKETERSPEIFIFSDPNYSLPWANFRAFLSDSLRSQSLGYLGLRIAPGSEAVAKCLAKLCEKNRRERFELDPTLSQRFGGHYYHLLLQADSPCANRSLWKKWSELLRTLLPLNGAGRLAGHVVDHAVDALHFVH